MTLVDQIAQRAHAGQDTEAIALELGLSIQTVTWLMDADSFKINLENAQGGPVA